MRAFLVSCVVLVLLMLPFGLLAAALPGEDGDGSREGRCPAAGEAGRTADADRLTVEEAAIEETLSKWAAAVREADIGALGSLVTDDAEFWTHGAAPLVGREALKEAFEPFFAGFELRQDFECQELIIAGAWAFMRGMETNQLVPRDGSDSAIHRQRAFSVLMRQPDGRWLFARGMTNLPPEE